MAKQNKAEKAQAASGPVPTNGWDVCIRFLDVVNDLFRTGNVFGAVLLMFFMYVTYVTYKLPPENINAFILMFSKLLTSEKFYIIPGSILLLVSFGANVFQHYYYTKEIKRLVSIRKVLVHGIKAGEMETLPEHSSSEFNIDTAV